MAAAGSCEGGGGRELRKASSGRERVAALLGFWRMRARSR